MPCSHHPASDTLILAPLLATQWHIPAARAGKCRSGKHKFKAYTLGYFHIDIAEVQTAQGRLYLLVAIDRVTKFAWVELHKKATRRVTGDFLCALVRAVP